MKIRRSCRHTLAVLLAVVLAVAALCPAIAGGADRPGGGFDASAHEARVEQFLDATTPGALAEIVARWESTGVGNWDYLKLPIFTEGAFVAPPAAPGIGRPAEGSAANTAVLKKALSKPARAELSQRLAEMRWAAIVDLWSEVAADNMVRIELIDSGKRQAFRSDVDVTVYAALEPRRELTLAALIKQFEQKFQDRFGYHYATLDVTVHDGDVFIPDVRNNRQSFAEFRATLADVADKLKLKVTEGGDAYYLTDANLVEVQRRGLRDGVVTVLEPPGRARVAGESAEAPPGKDPAAKPRPKQWRIQELDPHDGKWRVASLRFEGVTPVYDPSVGFGVLAQSLEEIIRHSDDLAAVAKYFNRAVNGGVGAGLVNSFFDLHVSTLPDGTPPDAAALKTAFDLETGRVRPGPVHRTKTIAKLRWLIRAFGYKGAELSPPVQRRLLQLHELLGVATEIEILKNTGKLTAAPEGNVPHPLDRIKEEVWRGRPSLDEAPKSVIYAEAAKWFNGQVVETIVEGLIASEKASLAALTVEGFRSNSFRFMHEDGGLMAHPNAEAATKLAHARARQLAQVFEIAHKLPAFPFRLSSIGPRDFIYGIGLDGRLQALQRRVGGQIVRDRQSPGVQPDAELPSWDDPKYKVRAHSGNEIHRVNTEFSIDTMTAALDSKRTIVFELTLMEDLEVILGQASGQTEHYSSITAEELRHARKVYRRYPGQIKFVYEKHGQFLEVPPPWEILPETAVSDSARMGKEIKRLVAALVDAAPPEIRGQVRLLSEAARLDLDGLLREFDLGGKTWAEALAEKVKAVDEAVGGQETGAGVDDQELREHAERALKLRSGMNWELLEKLLHELDSDLLHSTSAAGFVEGVRANLMPMMVTSSLVNLARAYQSHERWGFREAVIGEAFFYLPSQYAIAATALKDFGRGKLVQGGMSLATVAVLHALARQWPLAAEAVMGLNIALGIVSIEYVYIMEAMASDLMEHAFKSRYAGPLPRDAATGLAADGKRYFNALRSPVPDSPARAQDTPEFPLFWETECPGLSTPDKRVRFRDFEDGLPDWMREGSVRRDYRDVIMADAERRLGPAPSPNDRGYLVPPSVAHGIQRSAMFETLVPKYAFDLSYYQRISKIYDCFLPVVKARSPAGPDGLQDRSKEDDLLRDVFGRVVREWFTAQPPVYRGQFDSVWDIVGKPERDKKLEALVAHAVRLYHQYEEASFKAVWAREEMERQSAELMKNLGAQDKRLLGARKTATDTIEKTFPAVLLGKMAQAEPTSVGNVRLGAPTWILPANALVDIDLDAGGTRHDHPGPWKEDFALKVVGVERAEQIPPGLTLTTAEREKLDARTKPTLHSPGGRPEFGLYLTKLEATGSVADATGKLIGRAAPMTITGYQILPIPHYQGSVTVELLAYKPGDPRPQYLRAEIQVGQEKREAASDYTPLGSSNARTSFNGLPAGSYQVTVRPLSREWGPASASFTLTSPYTKEAYATASPPGGSPQNPSVVVVKVPYVGGPGGTAQNPAQPGGTASGQGQPGAPQQQPAGPQSPGGQQSAGGGSQGAMGPGGPGGPGGRGGVAVPGGPGGGTGGPGSTAGGPGVTQCAAVAAAGDAVIARARASVNTLKAEQAPTDAIAGSAQSFQQRARAMLAALPVVQPQVAIDCRAIGARIATIKQKLGALATAWGSLTQGRATAESESRAACTLAQQVKQAAPATGPNAPATPLFPVLDPRIKEAGQHAQAAESSSTATRNAAPTVTRLVTELRGEAGPLAAPLQELARLKALQVQMEGQIRALEGDAANAQAWVADLGQRSAKAQGIANDLQTQIASESGRLGVCLGSPEGQARTGELAAAGRAASDVVAALKAREAALADGLAAMAEARTRLSAVDAVAGCPVDDDALKGLASLKPAEQGAAQLPNEAARFASDARTCVAAVTPPPAPPTGEARGTMKVLTVTVAPDRVKPGQAVVARATYEVSGIAQGQFTVGDAVFVVAGPGGSQESAGRRAFYPGSNTQDQRIPTTATTPPGTYTITASIRTATGASNSVWTSFTVDAAGPTTPPPTAPGVTTQPKPPATAFNFAGTWDSNYGCTIFTQSGTSVGGRVNPYEVNTQITGTSDGSQLTFRWSDRTGSGTGELRPLPDGKLTGSFRGTASGTWTLARRSTACPQPTTTAQGPTTSTPQAPRPAGGTLDCQTLCNTKCVRNDPLAFNICPNFGPCSAKPTPENCGRMCKRYAGLTTTDEMIGGINTCYRGANDRESR